MPSWLTRTHYHVLYLAQDEVGVASAVAGAITPGPRGECFILVPPIPQEAARRALEDLVEAGFIQLSLWAAGNGEDRPFETAEALAALRDARTWDRANPMVEMLVTESGYRALNDAYKTFGGETDRATQDAAACWEEFRREHPDFPWRQQKYFEDMIRWVDSGEGDRPESPLSGY